MVASIQLSRDGAAIVVNERETHALCKFCGNSEPFAVPSLGALDMPYVYNKPQKWAVIFGGTRREPKRFFICEGCAKGICNGKA